MSTKQTEVKLKRMTESNSGFWSFVRTTTTNSSSSHHHPESNLSLGHTYHRYRPNPVQAEDRSEMRQLKRVRFSDTDAENVQDPKKTASATLWEQQQEEDSNDELRPVAKPRVTVAPQFGWRSSPLFCKRKHFTSSSPSSSSSFNVPTFSKFNWSSRRVF